MTESAQTPEMTAEELDEALLSSLSMRLLAHREFRPRTEQMKLHLAEIERLLALARRGLRDSERLDWIETRAASLEAWVNPDGSEYWTAAVGTRGNKGATLREAIDAARAASEGK